jgi:hypothetical protein
MLVSILDVLMLSNLIWVVGTVNYPTHKGMGLVIQVPISGQTTIGGLTVALSFRKSARIFIAAL